MRVIVTCGPAIAPIDDVRRITNFSTGELGVLLANALAAAKFEVVCLRGEAATSPLAVDAAVDLRPFSTNDDLLAKLRDAGSVGAVFHAAALCDFDVDSVVDEKGNVLAESKIPSRAGGLTIKLRPATKVLACLRDMFPEALLVGWKYELNGGHEDALAAGMRQFREARTNLCVVNGSAYGPGFGLLQPDGAITHVAGRTALCGALVSRLSEYIAR